MEDKIDNVKRILKLRNKSSHYTDVQIEALASYDPPQGTNFIIETQLERMAYGSTSIIENLGSVFVIWLFFFGYIIILQLARFTCCPLMKYEWFRKRYESMNKTLFWGSFIRFGYAIYIEVAIAS